MEGEGKWNALYTCMYEIVLTTKSSLLHIQLELHKTVYQKERKLKVTLFLASL